VLKPESYSFTEASALPMSALVAYGAVKVSLTEPTFFQYYGSRIRIVFGFYWVYGFLPGFGIQIRLKRASKKIKNLNFHVLRSIEGCRLLLKLVCFLSSNLNVWYGTF
jgi:hypothetical protein